MNAKGVLLLLCVAVYCNALCNGEVCRPLTYSQLLTPATCWMFDLDNVRSSERSFEFVLIVEIVKHANQTKMLYVKEILNHLIATTYTSNYGDFNAKFALAFYYVSTIDNEIVSTHFKSFYSNKELISIIDKATNYSWKLDTTPLSTNSLRYLTVIKSLQVLSELTNRKPVVTSIDSGKETTLYFNENSEKHFILFTDLFVRKKKKNAKTIDTYQITSDINEVIVSLEGNVDRSLKYAVTVALDPASTIATTTYGGPNYTQAYSDGTHFNKAMTLKALLKAKNEQSNTLQAHLLHKGVYMKTARLEDLRDGYRSLNPALWSSDSIYSSFVNHCSELHDCTHCSPLHGCYQPKTRKTSSLSKKYLMSGDYSGGGHGTTMTFDSNNNEQKSASEEKLTIYSPPLSGNCGIKLDSVVSGAVTELQWSPSRPFAETIISQGHPVILKNTTVTKWPALNKWTSGYLMKHLTPSTLLESVKCSNGFLTFDPDVRVPLKLNISVPFVTANMSSVNFFSCLHGKCSDDYKGYYYFGSVPNKLAEDMTNDRFLFLTKDDYDTRKQFVWVSSAGMITHGHFDQDYNFFVQISGKKRFTLWPSTQHELLYIYPRVHPMWHKSRVNFRNIDPQRFPLFLKSQALQVTVGPGDMLYIPPYTWHYVETLTPSVSLSTWSHDYRLYDHMNTIYKYDHKFDELANPKGRIFALRLFLDMMIHDLYGFNDTGHFFAHLLTSRFQGLEHLFPPAPGDEDICNSKVAGKIPTCIHVHGYVQLDMSVVGPHFESLAVEVRDILFMDYVEEISAEIVGVEKMLAFFRYCFLGQEYYVTEMGSDEHAELWQPV